ncbi:DUF4292 domain-containing protein [Myxococcota bacterium]|nr:DUF4292 domain-containing protein [Myxococcota bacterium]MBU1381279.1 DUF4292 domain-containing protein [Myxococcota bacterium]MBU1495991.1 DUF4292 domain-containing protein [Myxococcota bacterium]
MKRFALIFLIISTSCTGYKRTYPVPSASELGAALRKVGANNIRAKGKVDAMMPRGRTKVKVFLLADRTGRVRFDAVTPPPLNATVLLLTSDGSVLRAHDKDKNHFYEGKPDACSVKSILGIGVDVKDLYGLLSGTIPAGAEKAQVTWDRDCGCEKLVWTVNKKTYRAWIDGKNGKARWRMVKLEILEGKERIRVEYRGFKKVGKLEMPTRIRISRPGTKTDTIFTWSSLETEVEIEDEAWNQSIPENIEIRRLICPPGETGK